MKFLLKTVLKIGAIFASTFLIAKFTGLLSVEQVKFLFDSIKNQPVLLVGALSFFLLFLDLFIAVPTLTICILSGYFIGFSGGFIATLLGTSAAGVSGYLICKKYGKKILPFILKNEDERISMEKAFEKHSGAMILLSRALPILPEVSACLSGMTKMSFKRFLVFWHISSIPYTMLATYAGSISTFDNPKPAILAAIGISIFFWLSWFFFSSGKNTLETIRKV